MPKKTISLKDLPPSVADKIKEMHAKIMKREAWPHQYGKIRPVVHTMTPDGQRMVAVGAKLFKSQSDTTWHGFLYDHLQHHLGADWFWAEANKSEDEMHILLRWFKEVCEVEMDVNNKFSLGTPENDTGAILAFRSIAYDLFCIEQHSSVPEDLLERLKRPDHFEGARYELWVAACFLRAGFEIEYEDESDRRRTHCEFTAHHPASDEKYSVEAKRRHRVIGEMTTAYKQNKYIKLGITHLISNAVSKQAEHTRIVFVDVNMPPQEGAIVNASWMNELKASKERLEQQPVYRTDKAPWAFLLTSNHPYHYVASERPDPKTHFLSTSFNRPDYYKDPNKAVKEHRAVFELMQSIASHFVIPDDFP